MSFAAVRESRDCDPSTVVGHVDRLGEVFQGNRYPQSIDRLQVQFVDTVTIKRYEDVEAGRRVVPLDHRIQRRPERIGRFFVHRHDYHNLGSSPLVESVFDQLSAAEGDDDQAIYAEQPRYNKQGGERIESELLEEHGHPFREVLSDAVR